MRNYGLFLYPDRARHNTIAVAKIIPALHAGTASIDPSPAPIEKISLLVPVYRELRNGNLAALLENLREQSNPQRIHLVVIVNNSPAVAVDPASAVRQENQETLAWLALRREPFTLEVIDHATQGIERNMGIIRQKGVDALLSTDPERHIVLHMDCDTRFPKDFLERVARYYEDYADLEVLFFRRRYELRGEPSEALLHSHARYVRERAFRDLKIFLSHYREGFATYQISSRLSTLQKIGGFQPLPQGEDTQLSQDLLRFPHILAPDLEVATEDRTREDGFQGAERLAALTMGKRKHIFPRAMLFHAWLEANPNQEENFANFASDVTGENIHSDKTMKLSDAIGNFLYEEMAEPELYLFEVFYRHLPAAERAGLEEKLNLRGAKGLLALQDFLTEARLWPEKYPKAAGLLARLSG